LVELPQTVEIIGVRQLFAAIAVGQTNLEQLVMNEVAWRSKVKHFMG
jgi:hypothetical protein